MASHFTNLAKFNTLVETSGRDVTLWENSLPALEMVVHAADISSVTRPLSVALQVKL